jgi:hypothetical protein
MASVYDFTGNKVMIVHIYVYINCAVIYHTICV